MLVPMKVKKEGMKELCNWQLSFSEAGHAVPPKDSISTVLLWLKAVLIFCLQPNLKIGVKAARKKFALSFSSGRK